MQHESLATRKREEEISREISTLMNMLIGMSASRAIEPSIVLNPEVYLDGHGNPSRFLELRLGHRSTLRVGLERRRLADGGWCLGWNIFRDDRNVVEGEVSAPQVGLLRPTLSQILDQYLHIHKN